MRIGSLFLLATLLVMAQCDRASALEISAKEIITEMRLEGSCAKIFGRTKISFANSIPGQLPVAPITHDDRATGICNVILKYYYRQSSKPVVGLSVEGYRLLSTNSNGTQDEGINTVTTDRNGVARFRFRWQPSSCGVEFRIFDPSDPMQSNLSWPVSLLTADAFFQIRKCQGTFTSQGLSREQICNGEPKGQ
jgi:hypothetical protein